jgi:uncharacterized protein with HEPN domain
MQRDLDRLEDILSAAGDVIEFCAGLTRDDFASRKAVRFAILHSLTIIGEASSRLSEDYRANHTEVPWRRIIAFRHRVVHGYGELDLELVWEIARTLVPELRDLVAQLRADFPEET